MTLEALRLSEQALQLSEMDRHELAIVLWDSIGYLPPDDDDEWEAELNRRANEIESGKDVCESAENVFAELHEAATRGPDK